MFQTKLVRPSVASGGLIYAGQFKGDGQGLKLRKMNEIRYVERKACTLRQV
jgi:hypothetical protein